MPAVVQDGAPRLEDDGISKQVVKAETPLNDKLILRDNLLIYLNSLCNLTIL